MTWYGKDACAAPLLRESRHFSPAWGANAPKEGNESSILGIVYFSPWGNPDKSKG